jgi:hypothetical protein
MNFHYVMTHMLMASLLRVSLCTVSHVSKEFNGLYHRVLKLAVAHFNFVPSGALSPPPPPLIPHGMVLRHINNITFMWKCGTYICGKISTFLNSQMYYKAYFTYKTRQNSLPP